MQFEDKVIENILWDDQYANKVLPYTKSDYFEGNYKVIIDTIVKFYISYNTTPTRDELKIEIGNRKGITDKQLKEINETLDSYHKDDSDREWLIKTTEKFYQERSLTGAIITGASILEKGSQNTNEILKLVQDALSVSFDSNLGHDYFGNAQDRFDAYHVKEDKIPTGMRTFDQITLGGFSRKSLNCVIAQSGAGKTQWMVSAACNALREGYNTLYLTLEMSEVRIAERMDANLLDLTIPSLSRISLKQYTDKVNELDRQKHGRMIIKEFPTSTASVLHFKNLLNELKLKQGFIPDVIVVDYINLMTSSRYKPGQTNSYGMVKAISEELRGLAVETNTVIITATQTNRSGFGNSDIEMTEVSDSIGLIFTLDMLFALIRTDALDAANQVMFKQLKNRYSDLNQLPTFQMGINRDRMMIYDLNDTQYSQPSTFETGKQIVREPQLKVVDTRPVEVTPGLIKQKTIEPKNDFSKFTF